MLIYLFYKNLKFVSINLKASQHKFFFQIRKKSSRDRSSKEANYWRGFQIKDRETLSDSGTSLSNGGKKRSSQI